MNEQRPNIDNTAGAYGQMQQPKYSQPITNQYLTEQQPKLQNQIPVEKITNFSEQSPNKQEVCKVQTPKSSQLKDMQTNVRINKFLESLTSHVPRSFDIVPRGDFNGSGYEE
ncbi:hypothetical protein TVAG_215240 [Trichomonas vaginalis G3]|uniref:Uncharacterized protein n=1 Tax=Trichomonas vaginalis (strain ATCC PRA-98 / G3) TaxID=412133 RepID=A2F654_TRIV3|nr:hypothetical protein TVAGG3_0363970 [Trichomonas vaginalis G3]EAX99624.1 hypothetical protein TVAG_215240 [Trichomonas vaginalis G3]KAI5532139.1 hypothetical protein TVAGG3_0363970 [Trichomonas vaginalis G3]|eukprot:XP_001312554.1 hypothetical protein [Trichomonas vaginalis G3]